MMILLSLLLVAALAAPAAAGHKRKTLRFATYNASLNRATQGGLLTDLRAGDAQARKVADVIATTRPDVLLINEFDHDPEAAEVFTDEYRGGAYRYRYSDTCNTGVGSGFDLNGDGITGNEPGTVDYANDALGFGFFPGQYCMLVLSKHPIDTANVRTFQNFLWANMPGALLPAGFYSPEELEILPLSSKSHWDVPIKVGGKRTIHFLVSHPTPPTFDGPEDRNGTRNHDEIRFWADYVRPWRGRYIYDDDGRRGGLQRGASFVIAGDQNADPADGDSVPSAAQQLLDHRLINATVTPASEGGVEAAQLDGGINLEHEGDPAFDTADFGEPPGNLRVDYVLPRRNLKVTGAGVFWPASGQPGRDLIDASDHRLVWIDITARSARRR